MDKHYDAQVKEKKKANPRISCLDQLGDARRMMVPALTLTEGTPTSKKFFKSGTPLIPSTPTRKVVEALLYKGIVIFEQIDIIHVQ